jgi:hypothetical protein
VRDAIRDDDHTTTKTHTSAKRSRYMPGKSNITMAITSQAQRSL